MSVHPTSVKLGKLLHMLNNTKVYAPTAKYQSRVRYINIEAMATMNPNLMPQIVGMTVSYDGMAASFMTGNSKVPFYMPTPVSPHTFNMSHWTALPLSHRLGWPLRYQNTGEHNKSTFRKNLPANEVLELLTLELDPTSSTFGKSTDTCNCEIILANADASELHPITIKTLQSYIKMALKDVVEFGKGEGPKEKAEAAAARAVPSDLEPFLGAYCKNLVCKKCGLPGGWREHKLSACGKCQKVQCCGRECQAADWKAHKKDCKRE